MKYLLLGLMLGAAGSAAQAALLPQQAPVAMVSEGDSITLEDLVAMNKKKFKGKPIAEFLESEEAKGYVSLAFRHNAEGLLQGLKIKYSDKLYLNVYVSEFKNLVPFNPDKSWSMDALKKETIDEIRVVYVMHE